MSLPVAILAGGLATRLRPITEQIPKALVEVAGRPFAEHQLEWLRGHGVDRRRVLVGHLGEMMCEALGDGARWGVSVRYVFDGPRLLGTGGALPRAAGAGRCVLRALRRLVSANAISRRSSGFRASGKTRLDDRVSQRRSLGSQQRRVRWTAGSSATTSSAARRRCDTSTTASACFDGARFADVADGEAFDLAACLSAICSPTDDLAGFEVPERFYEIGSPAGLEETRGYLDGEGMRHEATRDSICDEAAGDHRGARRRGDRTSGRTCSPICAPAAAGCSFSASAAAPRTARTRSTTSASSPASKLTRRPTTSPS